MAVPPSDLEEGLAFVGSKVVMDDKVSVGLMNRSNQAIRPKKDDWCFIIVPK